MLCGGNVSVGWEVVGPEPFGGGWDDASYSSTLLDCGRFDETDLVGGGSNGPYPVAGWGGGSEPASVDGGGSGRCDPVGRIYIWRDINKFWCLIFKNLTENFIIFSIK